MSLPVAMNVLNMIACAIVISGNNEDSSGASEYIEKHSSRVGQKAS